MAKKKHTTKNIAPATVPFKPKDPQEFEEDEDEEEPDPRDNALHNALKLGTQGATLKRLTCVSELLDDKGALIELAETVAAGGSIETVEMRLGLPVGMMKGWLQNGRHDRDGPFHVFYKFYLTAAAEAKLNAEASLLSKNPAKWLETCDPIRQLQSSSPETGGEVVEVKAKSTVTYKEFPDE